MQFFHAVVEMEKKLINTAFCVTHPANTLNPLFKHGK
jgi:hypothetical protein